MVNTVGNLLQGMDRENVHITCFVTCLQISLNLQCFEALNWAESKEIKHQTTTTINYNPGQD